MLRGGRIGAFEQTSIYRTRWGGETRVCHAGRRTITAFGSPKILRNAISSPWSLNHIKIVRMWPVEQENVTAICNGGTRPSAWAGLNAETNANLKRKLPAMRSNVRAHRPKRFTDVKISFPENGSRAVQIVRWNKNSLTSLLLLILLSYYVPSDCVINGTADVRFTRISTFWIMDDGRLFVYRINPLKR
jgi:hypothetical protein